MTDTRRNDIDAALARAVVYRALSIGFQRSTLKEERILVEPRYLIGIVLSHL